MADPQWKNFQSRLQRIDRIHQAGGAFEANGTLGRAYFDTTRKRKRFRFPWRAIAMIFAGLLLFKATLFARVGTEGYDERIAALEAGSEADRIGAWVLSADPVTRWIAAQIAPYIRR